MHLLPFPPFLFLFLLLFCYSPPSSNNNDNNNIVVVVLLENILRQSSAQFVPFLLKVTSASVIAGIGGKGERRTDRKVILEHQMSSQQGILCCTTLKKVKHNSFQQYTYLKQIEQSKYSRQSAQFRQTQVCCKINCDYFPEIYCIDKDTFLLLQKD